MSKIASKRIPEHEITRTIDALLRAGYGEPTFPDGVAALDQEARNFFRSGSAGGSGPSYGWLQDAVGSFRRALGKGPSQPIDHIHPEQVVEAVEATTSAAEQLLSTGSVRRAICRALNSTSQDVFDIAKTVTPVLAGASIAGTVSIGAPVLLYAVASLIIARAGITSFCRGVAK